MHNFNQIGKWMFVGSLWLIVMHITWIWHKPQKKCEKDDYSFLSPKFVLILQNILKKKKFILKGQTILTWKHFLL